MRKVKIGKQRGWLGRQGCSRSEHWTWEAMYCQVALNQADIIDTLLFCEPNAVKTILLSQVIPLACHFMHLTLSSVLVYSKLELWCQLLQWAETKLQAFFFGQHFSNMLCSMPKFYKYFSKILLPEAEDICCCCFHFFLLNFTLIQVS